MGFVSVLMLPASEGDCLVVEYGDPAAPDRILIDGGRQATYRDHLRGFLNGLPAAEQALRLVVVSHVDRDHIEGCLALLRDQTSRLEPRDFWFNDYRDLFAVEPPRDVLGPTQGETLSRRLREKRWPRNAAFAGRAITTGATGDPRVVNLAPDVTITLLGPDQAALTRLEPVWTKACQRAGLIPGAIDPCAREPRRPRLGGTRQPTPEELAMTQSEPDDAIANGSSIAFLLECHGRRMLFPADATPKALLAAIGRLGYSPDNPLAVHLFKVPHHGSQRNVTQELARAIRADRYLVSTNGALFNHPDPEGIARLVVSGDQRKELYFNYQTRGTAMWDQEDWRARLRYDVRFGNGSAPTRINL